MDAQEEINSNFENMMKKGVVYMDINIGNEVKIKATNEVCKVTYVEQYSIYKGDGYCHLENKDRAYYEGELEVISS